MASPEWLLAHRELQYLRAAAACRSKRRRSSAGAHRRRGYAAVRWHKYREAVDRYGRD